MILVQKKLTESSDMFNIRGIFVEDEPMWRHCTMLIGGRADFYAVPEDEDDLKTSYIRTRNNSEHTIRNQCFVFPET